MMIFTKEQVPSAYAIAAIGICLSSTTVNGVLNSFVASAWGRVHAFSPSHWNLAEALVATLGFWAAGAFFECLHLVFPSVLKHRLHDLQSDHDKPAAETTAAKTTAAKTTAEKTTTAAAATGMVEAAATGAAGTAAAVHSNSSSNNGIMQKKLKVFTSLRFFVLTKVGGSAVYLGAIALFHLCVRAKPPLPLDPPTFLRLAAEVLSGVIGYDLLFTFVHWGLHAGDPRFAAASATTATAAAAAVAASSSQNRQQEQQTARTESYLDNTKASPAPTSFAWGAVCVLNPVAWLVTRKALKRLVVLAFGNRGPLRSLRSVANHGKHHEMRGALQAGATVHHSLLDGALQVVVNVLVQNNAHLVLLALPFRLLHNCLQSALVFASSSQLLAHSHSALGLALSATAANTTAEYHPHHHPSSMLDSSSLAPSPPAQTYLSLAWVPLACLLPLPLLAAAPFPFHSSVDRGRGKSPGSGSWLYFWAAYGSLVALGLSGHLAWAGVEHFESSSSLAAYWGAVVGSGLLAPSGTVVSWTPSPRHALSRFLHNFLVTWLLCEAHSGYDLPWMTHRAFSMAGGGGNDSEKLLLSKQQQQQQALTKEDGQAKEVGPAVTGDDDDAIATTTGISSSSSSSSTANTADTSSSNSTESGGNGRARNSQPPPPVMGGAPAHNRHHNRGDVHFQQFFTYLDQAHGTYHV